MGRGIEGRSGSDEEGDSCAGGCSGAGFSGAGSGFCGAGGSTGVVGTEGIVVVIGS